MAAATQCRLWAWWQRRPACKIRNWWPIADAVNAEVRSEVFAWLDRNGYSYIPSVSNCFLLNTGRPAKQAIAAMAQQNVIIGRAWPSMPTYSRITIGTREEMDRFQVAFQKVMNGSVTGRLNPENMRSEWELDGYVVRA